MSKRKTETGFGADIDAMLDDSDDERAGEMVGGAEPEEEEHEEHEGEEHEGVIEVVEEAPALGDVVLQRGVSLGRGDEETVAGLVDRVSALLGEQVHRVLDADLDGACASVGGLRANA